MDLCQERSTSMPMLQPPTAATPAASLDNKQLAALNEFQGLLASLIPQQVDREDAIEFCTTQTLTRYLRARRWNVKQASKMLHDTLLWRHNYRPQDITLRDVWTSASTGNNFVHGHDKLGRPVVYLIKRGAPGDNLMNIRLLVHNMELAAKCMPPGEEKLFMIIDLAGHNRSNSTPFNISKMTLDILVNHYPERLGVSYIVNAPSLYSYAWSMISPFLDSVTKSKIKFATVDPKTMHDPSKNVLLQEIDENVLLARYGGKCDFVYDVEQYEKALESMEGLQHSSEPNKTVSAQPALAPVMTVSAS